MSLQLPTILSPPTPCTPVLRSLCSPQSRSRSCRCPFPGRLPFWASPFPSRLANASGRIEFIIFLIIDWLFASGCSPPRLSATQLPSATDSQCFCPTGTSTPLLVRTLRRTRDTHYWVPPAQIPAGVIHAPYVLEHIRCEMWSSHLYGVELVSRWRRGSLDELYAT